MKFSARKKGLMAIGALFAMALSFPLVSAFLMRQWALPLIFSATSVPPAETALVFGAAAYPSGLSDILKDRMDTGIELFKAGKVKRLLLSGASDETEKMQAYALGQGLKPENLEQDPEGVNTLASLENASRTQKNLILVTQRFHLPRALFIARTLGISSVGVAADRHDYLKIYDFERREILASTKAMLDLFGLGFGVRF